MSKESICKCECTNILAYLKYSNPNDFCVVKECLEWGKNLSQCEFCSVNIPKKFCIEHIEKHQVIECFYCKKTNCIKKYSKDDWVISANINDYSCTNCRHNKYIKS